MASTAENNIFGLAQKYNLEQGKFADFYQLHSNWCITKNGATKIRHAEGISYDVMQSDKTNVSYVIFMEFTNKDGKTIQEIGSCRFDGTKNTPERSHAPEMAFKRCLVRGTLAMLGEAAQGVYGDEEFDTDFKKNGNAQPAPQPTPQPAPQQTQNPTVEELNAIAQGAAPLQTPSNSGFTPPPQGTKGWVQNGEKLPSDWNQLMGEISEITGLERARFELKMFDHCTAWQSPKGLFLQSSKFKTFGEYALGHKEWNGEVSYNAYGALKALNKGREAVQELKSNGEVLLNEVNGRGGMSLSYALTKKSNNPDLTGAPAQELMDEFGGTVDEIPF